MKFLFKVLKIICCIICWFVFFYWGLQAFQKFFSHPISTSITFKNGDDGLGNLNFPAITVCVLNYHQYLSEFLFKNMRKCEAHSINDFSHALQSCISLGPSTNEGSGTTEDYYGFGNLFDNDNQDTFDLFDTVDEFMNATKIQIYDLIQTFEYGKAIKITKNLGNELRKELLTDMWILSYDSRFGPCFTFDPERQNATFLSSGTDISGKFEAQKVYLEFQVSPIFEFFA